MVGKKAHRRYTGARFGVAVVIGVGVDVIDIGRAVRIENELERRDIQPFIAITACMRGTSEAPCAL